MPLYRYKCSDCQNEFEELRRMCEADDEIECPKCSGKDVKREMPSSISGGLGGGSSVSHPAGCSG